MQEMEPLARIPKPGVPNLRQEFEAMLGVALEEGRLWKGIKLASKRSWPSQRIQKGK